MDIKWHKVPLNCSGCNLEARILDLSVSRDGEILLKLICVTCSKKLAWKSTIANLVTGAAIADYIESHPILPAPEILSVEDKDFLRDMHIRPDEEAA